MKYCIKYKKNFVYMDDIDEIIINFNYKDTSLLKFLYSYQDKQIIIRIKDEKEFIENDYIKIFKAFEELKQPPKNYRFLLEPQMKELYKLIKETLNAPAFFLAFVNDWDTLWGYINLGVSDIYITESLGFEIDKVASILHERGITVRAFPNVCQSSWKDTDCLKTFFIRPEDVYNYEPYIDVLEFFDSTERQNVLYKIYAKDKKWFGSLQELISGFNYEFDSRFIPPEFALRRIGCGKKCLKNSNCKFCEKAYELSKVLKQNNLMFKIEDFN